VRHAVYTTLFQENKLVMRLKIASKFLLWRSLASIASSEAVDNQFLLAKSWHESWLEIQGELTV
jgi:hypothetical protein